MYVYVVTINTDTNTSLLIIIITVTMVTTDGTHVGRCCAEKLKLLNIFANGSISTFVKDFTAMVFIYNGILQVSRDDHKVSITSCHT